MDEKRNWLKSKRVYQGMTQKELAKRCGMTIRGLSLIENGKRNPSGEIAFKISKELGFDMEMFFNGKA